MKRALLIGALTLAGCGGGGGIHPPPIPPTPPPPVSLPPLHIQGTTLYRGDKPFDWFQWIQCCSGGFPGQPKANTLWPLNSKESMDWAHSYGANAFHFRMGPFHFKGEEEWAEIGPPYLGADALSPINPKFWAKADELVAHADSLGAVVEVVDLDTWGCKGQGVLQFSPSAEASCGKEANPEVERHIRQVVKALGKYNNVLWSVDNEGNNIPGARPEWFIWNANVIRDEEAKNGYARHLIGTNTNFPSVLEHVDFAISHDRTINFSAIAGKWSLNNERNPPFSPEVEASNFAHARQLGLGYALWRGWPPLTDAELVRTFELFRDVRAGKPAPVPECPDVAPGDFKIVAHKIKDDNPDRPDKVEITPKCRLEDGSFGPCLPESDPNKKVCELLFMGGTCPIWEWSCPDGPWYGQCPGTFNSTQSDRPWSQNDLCPWPPDPWHPAANRTRPEGHGNVRACDGTGRCSNWLRGFDQ